MATHFQNCISATNIQAENPLLTALGAGKLWRRLDYSTQLAWLGSWRKTPDKVRSLAGRLSLEVGKLASASQRQLLEGSIRDPLVELVRQQDASDHFWEELVALNEGLSASSPTVELVEARRDWLTQAFKTLDAARAIILGAMSDDQGNAFLLGDAINAVLYPERVYQLLNLPPKPGGRESGGWSAASAGRRPTPGPSTRDVYFPRRYERACNHLLGTPCRVGDWPLAPGWYELIAARWRKLAVDLKWLPPLKVVQADSQCAMAPRTIVEVIDRQATFGVLLKDGNLRPVWNGVERTLTLNGALVKQFRRNAPGNQEKLLEVFEEDEWAPTVDAPWPKHQFGVMDQTIKDLNRSQTKKLLRFSHPSSSEHVAWALSQPSCIVYTHR